MVQDQVVLEAQVVVLVVDLHNTVTQEEQHIRQQHNILDQHQHTKLQAQAHTQLVLVYHLDKDQQQPQFQDKVQLLINQQAHIN